MAEARQALSRRSALENVDAGPIAAGTLAIRLLAPRARFSLRLRPSQLSAIREVSDFALDMPINCRVALAEKAAIRLGPDEWLLSGPEDSAARIAQDVTAALAGLPHSLVDIGHRHVALGVAGTRAADVLSSGCPLDLSPPTCAVGFATRTLLGKAEVILAKTGDAPSFEIECARSFAAYVRDFLLEAARELRVQS